MHMKRKWTFIVALLVVASVAVPLISSVRARNQLSARENLLREKAAEARGLLDQNAARSNALSGAAGSSGLTPEEKRELLRLRGRIGELRSAAAEVERLKAQLHRASEGQPSEQQDPVPAQALVVWPADQLAYAGYRSPRAALQTAFWAMRSGDLDSFVKSIHLEGTSESRIRRLMEMPPDERALLQKQLADTLAPASAFHLLAETMDDAGDRCVVDVHFEGEGKTRQFVVRKIDQEWRFSGILFPGMRQETGILIR
jgi:hypothetical protein